MRRKFMNLDKPNSLLVCRKLAPENFGARQWWSYESFQGFLFKGRKNSGGDGGDGGDGGGVVVLEKRRVLHGPASEQIAVDSLSYKENSGGVRFKRRPNSKAALAYLDRAV
jgi:hypothetical protein